MLRLNKKLNISQSRILPKMQAFLWQKKRLKKIPDLNEGHCKGFTDLFLLAAYLEKTQDSKPANAQNLRELTRTLAILARWNPSRTRLRKKNQEKISQLILALMPLQNPEKYLQHTRQLETKKSFKQVYQQALYREYTLAAVFTKGDLSKPIPVLINGEEQLLAPLTFLAPKHCLVHITSHNHATGLFFDGKKYYFYDANHRRGAVTYGPEQLAELETHIFKANDYTEQAILGFTVSSLEPSTHCYPSQRSVLRAMTPNVFFTTGKHDEFTAFDMACDIQCKSSKKYYEKLYKNTYLDHNATSLLGKQSLFWRHDTLWKKPSLSPAAQAALDITRPEL